jgi:hypothetical protein
MSSSPSGTDEGSSVPPLKRLDSTEAGIAARKERVMDRLLVSAAARWLPLLLLLSAAVLFVLRKGQDANWDLRNYHLYNPHAFLEQRSSDIAAAQLQGWYNPLLDLPFYVLATSQISGLWASLWLLLPALIGFLLVMMMLRRLWPPACPPLLQLWAGLVLAASVVGGAAAAPSLGTSMNEWFVAAGVMTGLWALIAQQRSVAPQAGLMLFGGALAGAVAGLKLTAVSYCLGLGGACAVLALTRREFQSLLSFGLAGLVGGLLTAGPWALHLWQETGNPVFPYMNDVFRSEFARPESFVFDQFKPEGLGAALLGPLRLAQGGHWFSELELRDPRLLLGQIAASLVLLRWLWRPRVPVGALELLAVFWWLSFAAWISLHAIYRYAIVLELVACLLVVGLLLRLPRLPAALGLLGLLLIVQLGTLRPNWGRGDFTTPFIANDWPQLPANSALITLDGDPLGYAAIGLGNDVPILGLANNIVFTDECRPWQRIARARVESAEVLYALLARSEPQATALANAQLYGLEFSGECQRVASTLEDFWLCPLRRHGEVQCR